LNHDCCYTKRNSHPTKHTQLLTQEQNPKRNIRKRINKIAESGLDNLFIDRCPNHHAPIKGDQNPRHHQRHEKSLVAKKFDDVRETPSEANDNADGYRAPNDPVNGNFPMGNPNQ